VAIKRGEVGAQIREIEELINAAKQMTGRNVVVKVERVEQAVLVTAILSHYLKQSPIDCLIIRPSTAARSSRVFQRNRPIAATQALD
jgi:precorrin-6B methylase 2